MGEAEENGAEEDERTVEEAQTEEYETEDEMDIEMIILEEFQVSFFCLLVFFNIFYKPHLSKHSSN